MISRASTSSGTLLDCGNGYGLGLGERVATNRHEPCDGARGWRPAQVAAGGLFCLAAACGPLANDPKAAAKPVPFEASPQLRSVPLSGCPLLVKPLQIQIERTLPDAEDIRALTAQYLADKAATVPGTAHNLLDGDPFLGQSENDAVGLFSA
jgi:hypothetical protein